MAKAPGVIRVVIAGGYGNFGGYVARRLAGRSDIQLVLAGRDKAKANQAAAALCAANPAQGAFLDIKDPQTALQALQPDLVINMVGPYHTQGYDLAQVAIACGAHYCDIADSRRFVGGIGVLDTAAKAAGVAVIAGASSVPCLTAVYMDEALRVMPTIRSVEYGISGAEQSNRGTGTVAAVLSYVGQKFTHLSKGGMAPAYGWGDLHAVRYPELGWRLFGAGDIPDLDIFPARYPTLENHRFWAGHEIALLHLGTWALGLLARVKLLPRLDRFAPVLLQCSKLFNWMGKGRSGFHMEIRGEDADGQPMVRKHWMVARSGDGPNIPCIPVILIAHRLAEGGLLLSGAQPCVGIFTLSEFLAAMAPLDHSLYDEV